MRVDQLSHKLIRCLAGSVSEPTKTEELAKLGAVDLGGEQRKEPDRGSNTFRCGASNSCRLDKVRRDGLEPGPLPFKALAIDADYIRPAPGPPSASNSVGAHSLIPLAISC